MIIIRTTNEGVTTMYTIECANTGKVLRSENGHPLKFTSRDNARSYVLLHSNEIIQYFSSLVWIYAR